MIISKSQVAPVNYVLHQFSKYSDEQYQELQVCYMQTIKWKVGPILCCRRCIEVSFELNLPLHKMNIYEHKFPKSP